MLTIASSSAIFLLHANNFLPEREKFGREKGEELGQQPPTALHSLSLSLPPSLPPSLITSRHYLLLSPERAGRPADRLPRLRRPELSSPWTDGEQSRGRRPDPLQNFWPSISGQAWFQLLLKQMVDEDALAMGG